MTGRTPRTRKQTALRLASPDWNMASTLKIALHLGQMALPGKSAKDLEAAIKAMTPKRRETLIELVRRWNQLMVDAMALEASIDAELEQQTEIRETSS